MGGPKKMTVIINHLIEKYTNPSQAKVFCSLVKTGKSKEYTFNYVLSSIVEQC